MNFAEKQAGSPHDIQQIVLPIRKIQDPEHREFMLFFAGVAPNGFIQSSFSESSAHIWDSDLDMFCCFPKYRVRMCTF